MSVEIKNIDMNLSQYTDRIKTAAEKALNSYIEIGVLLCELEENKLYQENGFSTLLEYAEHEFQFKKSSVYNFMKIADRFSIKVDGKPTEQITDEYKDYKYSQLVELAKVKDEEVLEKVDPTMSVREITKIVKESKEKSKKEENLEEQEIDGQISVYDVLEKKEDEHIQEQLEGNMEKDEKIIEVQYEEVRKEKIEKEETFQTFGKVQDEEEDSKQEEPKEIIIERGLDEIFSDDELNLIIRILDTNRRLIINSEDKELHTKAIKKLEKHLRKDRKCFDKFKPDTRQLPDVFKGIFESYKKQCNVSRIVYYPNKSLKIEFVGKRFRNFTIDGKQEKIKEKKIETVPIQEILYFDKLYYSRDLSEKQKIQMEELKNNPPEGLKHIVHRLGDYILLVIFEDRVEMISEGGVMINFKDMEVKYEEHEVIWTEY